MTFLYRPDCKECQMVKAWLDKRGVEYEERDMNACPPTGEEIMDWGSKGRIPLKHFLRPRRFSLRMILLNNQMALAERHTRALIIAAAHEHMVCPIMVGDDFAVIGTDNAQWRRALNITD